MLYKTIVLLAVAWLLVTGIVLASLAYMSWLTAQRMLPLEAHIPFYNELHSVYAELTDHQPEPGDALKLAGGSSGRQEVRERLVCRLDWLVESEDHLWEQTGSELAALARRLEDAGLRPRGLPGGGGERAVQAAVRTGLRAVLRRELAAQEALLEQLHRTTETQWQVSLTFIVILLLAAAMTVTFFKRRVSTPLNDLTYLMGLLSRRDYASAYMGRVDPLMRPLFERYNRMVDRLRAQEQEHLALETRLRQELGQTMRQLVRQQRSLGRAERLAAAGDLAGRVAHELRNPLAAVLVGLGNLREDVVTDDKRRRVEQMMRELERIAEVLSGLLKLEDMEQEPRVELRLAPVLDEIVALIRLQLDEEIAIQVSVPEQLTALLPEAGFRHAVFDLLTNSVQAAGGQAARIVISARRHDDELVIRVVNDGPGCPRRLLEAAEGGPSDWQARRTVLSLALVHRFVHNLDGRLELRNPEAGGAVIEVRLPLER